MAKKILALLSILTLLLAASGCAVNRATASLTPGADLSGAPIPWLRNRLQIMVLRSIKPAAIGL